MGHQVIGFRHPLGPGKGENGIQIALIGVEIIDMARHPVILQPVGQTLTARRATADAAGAYIAAIRGYPKTAWAPSPTTAFPLT